MASIQTGAGHGSRRAVDHEVPLVPFIDLLLCCVMFLLVTAVWNRLAMMPSPLPPDGHVTAPAATDTPMLTLHVRAEGFVLASSAGDHQEIARDGGLGALRLALATRQRLEARDTPLHVAAEDGILYEEIIAVMDAAVGSGFRDVALRDAQ